MATFKKPKRGVVLPGQTKQLLKFALPGLFLSFVVLYIAQGDDGPNWETDPIDQGLNVSNSNSTPGGDNGRPTSPDTNGQLKILVPAFFGKPGLSALELGLLSDFITSENITHELIVVDSISSLRKQISTGGGDIIASLNEELLHSIEREIIYTLPWAISKQQVIGRIDSNVNNSLLDLSVRQIAVKKSSESWKLLSEMSVDNQGMEIQIISESEDVDTILQRVNSGQYDLAVLDSLSLPADFEFHYNLEAVLDLSNESFMTWGVRPEAVSLHKALNKFLSRKHLESGIARSYKEDLQLIKQRKLLRLVTYQSPVNYFYERGRLKGFEYDLINKFAEHHGMRVDVVIAESHERMLELLNDGKGDIIAASAPESWYANNKNVKVTTPYNYSSLTLIGREEDEISDIRDLHGRTIHLPKESPYLETLQRVKGLGFDLAIVESEAEVNTEIALFRVARGIYDLTVIASHEIKAELSRQLNLKSHITLNDPQPLVWVVRDSSTQLLSALNEFISNEYRKGFYNVVFTRYIGKPETRRADARLLAQFDQLSPYDEIVHKYADYYGFDWRLIVAQMYQESHFNPQAVSYAGAEGLMQLLPTTADMIGIKNSYDPR